MQLSQSNTFEVHSFNLIFGVIMVWFQKKDDQVQVIGNLKNISMASSKLLLAAKSLSVDPGAANAKNLLAAAARYGNEMHSMPCKSFHTQ